MLSTLAIILANLYPLFGFLFLGWDWRNFVLVYWIETLAYFVLTYYRMHFSKVPTEFKIKKLYLYFYGLFFGLQTFALFMVGDFGADALLLALFNSLPIVASHIYSIYEHYYRGGERFLSFTYFWWPMKRVWINQLTIILGPIFFARISNGGSIAIILILAKTAVDTATHWVEHRSRKC